MRICTCFGLAIAVAAGASYAGEDVLIAGFDDTFDSVYPGAPDGEGWLFPDGSDGGNDYLLVPDVFDSPFVTEVQPGVGPSQGSHAVRIVHYGAWPPSPPQGEGFIQLRGGQALADLLSRSDGWRIDSILPLEAEWAVLFGILNAGNDTGETIAWSQLDGEVPYDDYSTGTWTTLEFTWDAYDNGIKEGLATLAQDETTWVTLWLVPIGGGADFIQYFDNCVAINVETAGGPCNDADMAEPYGTLDIDDVLGFLSAFAGGDMAADIAPAGAPNGVLDIDDVLLFLSTFAAGCP